MRVTSAVMGAFMKFAFALGARLKPMSATIAPVTTGGMSFVSQPVPANCTITPTKKSDRPAMTIPPSAPAGPCWFVAAARGAINAKEEPR